MTVTVPSILAITSPPPSGQYLRLSDYHLLQYNNETGLGTDLGTSFYPTSTGPQCNAQSYASPYNPTPTAQCGQCVYLPSSGQWATPGSQYTVGRCVSVDATNPHNAALRGDVRIWDSDASELDTWDLSARGNAYNVNGYVGDPVVFQWPCKTASFNGVGWGVVVYCTSTDFTGVPGARTGVTLDQNVYPSDYAAYGCGQVVFTTSRPAYTDQFTQVVGQSVGIKASACGQW